MCVRFERKVEARGSPRGALIPPPKTPSSHIHLDRQVEAIIFAAPKARFASMRIRLSDLM